MPNAVSDADKAAAFRSIEEALCDMVPVRRLVPALEKRWDVCDETARNWIRAVQESWSADSGRPGARRELREQAVKVAQKRMAGLFGDRASTMSPKDVEARAVQWMEQMGKFGGLLGPEGEQLGQVAEVRMFLPAPGGYAGPGFERSCPHCGECIEEDEEGEDP